MRKIAGKVITIYSFTFLICEFLSIPDSSIPVLVPVYEWIHQFRAYEVFFICLGTVPLTLIIVKIEQLIHYKDTSHSTSKFEEILLLFVVMITDVISFFVELKLLSIGLFIGLIYIFLFSIYLHKKNRAEKIGYRETKR